MAKTVTITHEGILSVIFRQRSDRMNRARSLKLADAFGSPTTRVLEIWAIQPHSRQY
jgi:hypothetical protein